MNVKCASSAGRAARDVGNHYREIRTIVGSRRGRSGIRRRSRAADGGAVLAPLVAERGRACGGYVESRRFTHHSIRADRLRRDRWSHHGRDALRHADATRNNQSD